jgi:hypothetical protein
VQRRRLHRRSQHVVHRDGFLIASRGFIVAHCRVSTAMRASCSDVVPYTAMCRLAARAYAPIGTRSPYGRSQSAPGGDGPANRPALSAPPGRRRSLRGVAAYTPTTTSHRPAAMAAAACSTWISKLEPPTAVPSTKRGCTPRYSAIGAT